MNKYLIFLFTILLAISISSCMNNKDEDEVTPPSSVVLTLDNIAGSWEVYYLTRSTNGNYPLRDYYIDGSTITYNKDKSFIDTNIDGVTKDQGKFEIIGKDSIEVTLTTKSGRKLKAGQEIREIHIIKLNEKMMVRSQRYEVNYNGRNMMENVQWMRNVNKISNPNETPELPEAQKKEIININKLLGTWQIKGYEYYGFNKNTQTGHFVAKDTDIPIGQTIRFYIENGDNKYIERKSNGDINTNGTFRIVDDVVHLFSTNGEAFSLGLKNWGNNGSTDTVTDYQEGRVKDEDGNEDPFVYTRQYTYFVKTASE